MYGVTMRSYQGPALYSYNDATFSEEDWRGIKMLQNSIKKDDPLKVGRFGLGFKSVFHMTGALAHTLPFTQYKANLETFKISLFDLKLKQSFLLVVRFAWTAVWTPDWIFGST